MQRALTLMQNSKIIIMAQDHYYLIERVRQQRSMIMHGMDGFNNVRNRKGEVMVIKWFINQHHNQHAYLRRK